MRQKFIFIAFLPFLISCQESKYPELTACFEVNDEQPLVGDVVQFVTCSNEATNIEWSFGDNDDSNIRNPSHRYETGEYVITQTVYNDLNESSSMDKIIVCSALVIDSIYYFSDDKNLNPIFIVYQEEQYYQNTNYINHEINTYYKYNKYILKSDFSISLPLDKLHVEYQPRPYSSWEQRQRLKTNFYDEIDRSKMKIEYTNDSNDIEVIVFLSRAEI